MYPSSLRLNNRSLSDLFVGDIFLASLPIGDEGTPFFVRFISFAFVILRLWFEFLIAMFKELFEPRELLEPKFDDAKCACGMFVSLDVVVKIFGGFGPRENEGR